LVGRVLALFDIDRPVLEGNLLQFPKWLATTTPQVFSAAQICLLDGKAVPMHRRPVSPPNGLHELELRNRRALVNKYLHEQPGEPEVVPPYRFVFTTVPIQHIAEQPARLLPL